jgi:hypothetical protein
MMILTKHLSIEKSIMFSLIKTIIKCTFIVNDSSSISMQKHGKKTSNELSGYKIL